MAKKIREFMTHREPAEHIWAGSFALMFTILKKNRTGFTVAATKTRSGFSSAVIH